LDTGEIPDDWREASMIPLYKKGDRHNAANYMPVSCKILEHVIHSQIMDHYERLGYSRTRNMALEADVHMSPNLSSP
jgi:hypothetical protein